MTGVGPQDVKCHLGFILFYVQASSVNLGKNIQPQTRFPAFLPPFPILPILCISILENTHLAPGR